MAATVTYPGGSLEFPIEDDRIVGVWSGPSGWSGSELVDELHHALDQPIDFPALSLAIVPGDRVTLAVDPNVPELPTIIAAVINVIEAAGVERDKICVLFTGRPGTECEAQMPPDIVIKTHDLDDRESLSYLATTSGERRIYLNREATDADFVLPIGRIRRDSLLGALGPWTTLFPDLSDRESRRDLAKHAGRGGLPGAKAVLQESEEIGWLMGNQFQIGIVPGATGVASVIAGASKAVRDSGLAAWDAAWTFRADRRADIVVVGVSEVAGIEGTWSAFALATSLVRRGGKIVAISNASGSIGPATSRLTVAEGPGAGVSALRGSEGEPDYPAARQLADALAWADLYLFSGLEPDVVEDLGLIPLAKPEEARRLAMSSPQVILVSNADLTRGEIAEDDE